MKDALPPAVLERPKVGFDIPIHEWFRGHAATTASRYAQRERNRRIGLFYWPAINKLINEHLDRKANWGYHLWGLMMLILWIKQWKVQAPERSQRRRGSPQPFPCRPIVLWSPPLYSAHIVSPPSLMDDVDAVQAQIARNMLESGDWVTARLDGVAYLEKSPLIYWMMATSYRVFGVHDWAAACRWRWRLSCSAG